MPLAASQKMIRAQHIVKTHTVCKGRNVENQCLTGPAVPSTATRGSPVPVPVILICFGSVLELERPFSKH